MPRFARVHAPGALVHVVSRFINGEFRLSGTTERAAALERIPLALARTDWTLHAYALMSSHVHLALTAGHAPQEWFTKSLFVSLAGYLNRVHGRFGPVMADRPTSVVLPRARMGALVAYLHNNPGRAGVVDAPEDSDWTSHRAWAGHVTAPPWLAIAPGLRAAGFAPSAAGRAAFARFVRERAGLPRDVALSGRALSDVRTRVRTVTALPVELGSSDRRTGDDVHHVRYCGALAVAPRWEGDVERLVVRASREFRCPVEAVRSRTKCTVAIEARRLVMVAGVWLLRRRVNELAAALTISDSSASRLLRRGEWVLDAAREIAEELRAETRTE
jgi:putative transposase